MRPEAALNLGSRRCQFRVWAIHPCVLCRYQNSHITHLQGMSLPQCSLGSCAGGAICMDYCVHGAPGDVHPGRCPQRLPWKEILPGLEKGKRDRG